VASDISTVWVWAAQGPDRGAVGVTDDERRARKLARESLLNTGASEVLVEQVSVELGIKTLSYGYVRTGQGWHGRRTPTGRVTWRRFYTRECSSSALRRQVPAH
jgi:hypothetical protein